MEKDLIKEAHRIHEKNIIIDGHFDMLVDVLKKRNLGYTKIIEREYIPSFIEGGVNVVVCSIFIEDAFLPEMGLRVALDQISALYSEIEESSDKIMLCKTYEDIIEAVNKKKIGLMLSLEGADPIGEDLKLLRIFYELGVRLVGLVWSRRNYVADGCHFSSKKEGKKGGVTAFGVEVLKEMENLGMIVDVSHLNDEGFWDVMEIFKGVVIASHSNCRELAPVMRNLEDSQIKAIADKKGVLGMNVCSAFVSSMKEERTTEHLVKHVNHISKLVGIEQVALGLDFCDFLRATEEAANYNPGERSFDVIKGHKNLKDFTIALLKEGYNEEDIALILGGNLLNLFKRVL